MEIMIVVLGNNRIKNEIIQEVLHNYIKVINLGVSIGIDVSFQTYISDRVYFFITILKNRDGINYENPYLSIDDKKDIVKGNDMGIINNEV